MATCSWLRAHRLPRGAHMEVCRAVGQKQGAWRLVEVECRSSDGRQDYLYELSAAVRKLAPESHDSHLYALEVSSVFCCVQTWYWKVSLQTRCRKLDAERGDALRN